LLEILPRCVEACPALRFVWVGDGPHRERYLERLSALGLRDRVHLTGLVPPERVPNILAGADMVVHLSQWEGLPRVLVQALLLEVPVISFDNDGAPEVNRPGETGELVTLNDMPGLKSAMIKLAEDEPLRRKYGRRGRELCIERFDHRLMVRRLDETYAELVDARKRREP
jgi:glycosyltransferase involved in cell wall biosynthesis